MSILVVTVTKHKKMATTNTTRNLSDFLADYKSSNSLILAKLCTDGEAGNFLMEEVIRKLQSQCATEFKYVELNKKESQNIKDELRMVKSPILLLIQQGILKDIYAGNVGYDQLCEAISVSAENSNEQNIN